MYKIETMKQGLLFLFLLGFFVSYGQHSDQRMEVIGVVERLFEGMCNADSSAVRNTFHPDIRLQTTYLDNEGNPQMVQGDIERFLGSISESEPGTLNEVIWSYDIRIAQNVASVWTPYSFFVKDKLSHCGVNTFQLFRSMKGWQIVQIMDTRQRDGCQTEKDDLQEELNTLIDNWHLAAAEANEDAFFGAMAADGVYIGTDKTERWLRDELRVWAKAAFERESAWSFTAIDRVISLAPDGRVAWWDETLDTWMGVCRSTGILAQTDQGWKIKHYQLSVTVPNEKIEDFKALVEE